MSEPTNGFDAETRARIACAEQFDETGTHLPDCPRASIGDEEWTPEDNEHLTMWIAGNPNTARASGIRRAVHELWRLQDTRAALTAENERLKAVAEEVRTVRCTLMYVSSLLCEPVTDKNIRNARKAMEPLYYDALRDVKAERAALPSSRETTDG